MALNHSEWDCVQPMNTHVTSDRNLSTSTSLAFGVEQILTGLIFGPSLLISVLVASVIKVRHLVAEEEDLSSAFDPDGIAFGCRMLLSELGHKCAEPSSLVEWLSNPIRVVASIRGRPTGMELLSNNRECGSVMQRG